MAITAGNGANVMFDPIGGPMLETLANAAASTAIIFEYGALSTEQSLFPLFSSLAKGLTVRLYLV